MARKSHCVNGHEIAVVGRNKWGQCYECNRVHARKWAIAHPGYDEMHRDPVRRAKYNRDYYAENRDDLLAKRREYYASEGPEVRRERYRKWVADDGVARKKRDKGLRRRYGIGADEVDAILASQGGQCAVCGATEPGSRGYWNVDHCHQSGDVRGILCWTCNSGIGALGDTDEAVLRAYKYLEAFYSERKHLKLA